jgi:hypothetical protein
VTAGIRRALLRANRVDLHHERHVAVELEPFRNGFAQDRRRERTERLAPLDLEVQDVLHVWPARVADDRAVAERARPPFHPSLEPADDQPIGHRRRGSAAKFLLVDNTFDGAARARNLPHDARRAVM